MEKLKQLKMIKVDIILSKYSFWNGHQVADLSIVFPKLQLESYRKGKVPGWK